MKSILTKVYRFIHDEEGLELSEYAVAGSLIVIGTIAAFTLLGDNIEAVITSIANLIGGGAGTP